MGIWKLSIEKPQGEQADPKITYSIRIREDWGIDWDYREANRENLICNKMDKPEEYMMYGGKKHLVLAPYVLKDLETGEVIDLRNRDRKGRSNDE